MASESSEEDSAQRQQSERLPKGELAKAEERRQIYQRLCELQEQDLLNGAAPSDNEKNLIDAALAEYERDGDRGRPCRGSRG